ncbi:unnamed protein product [Heterobilharzia americana]|nr:unnamed protein product [Heterobilharzia americana]
MSDFVVFIENSENDGQPKVDQLYRKSSEVLKKEAEVSEKYKKTEKLNYKSDTPNRPSDGCLQEFRPLTREDLVQLDKNEPIWWRIRIGLLIGFSVICLGLLAGSIAYMSLGPKCAYKPKLPFWRSTVGYWLDVFAFKDSSGDLVGDLTGLMSEVDYIKNVIGAGYVILDSITKGFYTNTYNVIGLVEDYEELDEAVGTMEDFRLLIKRFHKEDLKVILTLDFNSVSSNHKWVVEGKVKLAKFPENVGVRYTRYGKPLDVMVDGQKYYSVFGSPSVDLDLMDSDTQRAILDVIGYWMKEGVDGILLDNCAFLVEDSDAEMGARGTTQEPWLTGYPIHQLYRNESVTFVGRVRQEIDEWSKKTGKEKLLAVFSGDTGYFSITERDPMLMFRDVADVIISELFITKQHEGAYNSRYARNIRQYASYADDEKEKLGLCISTPSDLLSKDVIALAATILLPGSSIIYYGTELGLSALNVEYRNDNFYPKNALLGVSKTPLAHLPMPWSLDGRRFSNAINDSSFITHLQKYDYLDTVETSLAEGRGESVLSLVRSLVALRENPSLKWGVMELIDPPIYQSGNVYWLFARRAEGYPTFIVALIKSYFLGHAVLDFTSICSSVTPRAVYPSISSLPVNVPLSTSKIFIENGIAHNRVLVFQCK